MVEACFEDIGAYVTRRKNTVMQYIVTQHILDLFERSVWSTGVWLSQRWWEQDGLDLEGSKERKLAESEGEEAQ